MSAQPPEHFFERADESADELFYQQPRLVTHIDDATIDALTAYYGEVLPAGGALLDLMSSWISHLPPDAGYREVVGLGMNEQELKSNERLTQCVVHNLNTDPCLPYAEDRFDAVMIAVSVQYLTQPYEVFREIARVLRPGGRVIVAMSHRLFPTKAVMAFRALNPQQRIELVQHYLALSGFQEFQFVDRSPESADPLWVVTGLAQQEGAAAG